MLGQLKMTFVMSFVLFLFFTSCNYVNIYIFIFYQQIIFMMKKNEEGKLTKGYSNFHFKYRLWSFDRKKSMDSNFIFLP